LPIRYQRQQKSSPAPDESKVFLVDDSLADSNKFPALLRAASASLQTSISTGIYAAPVAGGTPLRR
jgi:hypothetical protein